MYILYLKWISSCPNTCHKCISCISNGYLHVLVLASNVYFYLKWISFYPNTCLKCISCIPNGYLLALVLATNVEIYSVFHF